MTIYMMKFGAVLTYARLARGLRGFFAVLSGLKEQDDIVDFDGVSVFSPSWGDEFLTPLKKRLDTVSH